MNPMTTNSVFATLNAINCNDKVEKKGNLSYLSWAWAWQIVKQNYPEASYTIYEDANGIPYFTDGKTCWVKTGVTINGLEHIEYLPIMDFKNRSIPFEQVTSMDMNKTIQRSLTKCIGRHGLGLYLYQGEDLPESAEQPAPAAAPKRGRPQQYQPVSDDNMRAMAARYAQGIQAQTGEDYRTAWINFTHAGAEQIAMFDEMVYQYKVNNNIR